MVSFTIRVADRLVGVHAIHESTRSFCRDYLSEEEPEFRVEITAADLRYEREKSEREDRIEGLPPRSFSDAYLETIALLRRISERLFDYGTLLFHGSAVAVDGWAYLFTAKSGTGKSTHTRLWREQFGDRAVMINDDKPFLQIDGDRIIAWGSPWNGKHRLDTNAGVPLRGICILERGEENHIQRISPREALFMLIQQSSRPAEPARMPRYMELIDGLAKGTSFYRLTCNMNPQAAQVSYHGMRNG